MTKADTPADLAGPDEQGPDEQGPDEQGPDEQGPDEPVRDIRVSDERVSGSTVDAETTAGQDSALPRALQALGSVFAPTTLLTALFIHFGMMDAIGYFRYFGLNITVLDLPFQQYLTLSSDSAVPPLLCLAAATLVGLWLYRLPLRTLTGLARRVTLRVLTPALAGLGVVLVVLAVIDLLSPGRVFPATFPEGRGLSLAAGALLLSCAARVRRVLLTEGPPGGVATVAVVFLLVSIGLFWAVGSYAFGVGETRARDFAARLACRPAAVLYSEKSLNLGVPGVRETAGPPDAAYRFRYDGLALVPQSGSQYVFLPTGWTPADGVAVVVPRGGSLRLEFSRATELRNPACR